MSRGSVFRLLLVSLLLCVAQTAFGCLWDMDTLANEAKGLPDVVQVITGRFERNPPLYYEIRLKRVTAGLAKNPTLLEDYDNAGVACDRLSRDDEAIAWMGKKRVPLQKLDRNSAVGKENWYHYYANIGTFRMLRWLRAGADRKHIAEMEQARNEIATAIEINPNAHFGREKVQLAMIAWIVKPTVDLRGKEKTVNFWEYIADSDSAEYSQKLTFHYRSPTGDITQEEWIKGLKGLIVLGDTWESVDTFDTLAWLLNSNKATIGYLARLRCQELVTHGRKPLFPDELPLDMVNLYAEKDPGVYPDHLKGLQKKYQQLRTESEEWQQRRTDYMMVRLQAGRHPDTDTAFWNDWQDDGPPNMDMPGEGRNPNFEAELFLWIVLGFLVVSSVIAIIWWRRRRVRRGP